jgi:hypothetical protein
VAMTGTCFVASSRRRIIREAENLREGFGDVFLALPPELDWGQVTRLHADFPANMVEQRGIEPRTSALRTRRSPS